MSKDIEITNTAKPATMQVFNLPHDQYCAYKGKCACTVSDLTQVVSDPDGNKKLKTFQKRIPGSLRIPARETVPGTSDLLHVKEIRNARDRGLIKVKYPDQTQTQEAEQEAKPEAKAEEAEVEAAETEAVEAEEAKADKKTTKKSSRK